MAFKVDRDDRVLISSIGCFHQYVIVDVTLDQLPDAEFDKVKDFIEALGSEKELETDGDVSSGGYVVEHGKKNFDRESLSEIFSGCFKPQPKVIEQAISVLEPYMPNYVPKPNIASGQPNILQRAISSVKRYIPKR